MASLNVSNPHVAGQRVPHCCGGPSDAFGLFTRSKGAPVTERSKIKFQVHFDDRDWVFADVRLLLGYQPKKSSGSLRTIPLEFFFDGESDQIRDQHAFTDAVSETILRKFRDERIEAFRSTVLKDRSRGEEELLSSDAAETSEDFKDDLVSTWSNYSQTEDPIFEIFTENPLRDAGCMLRFVAVRAWVDEDTANFVGRVCFPEVFGGMEEKDDRGLPFWVKGMIGATGVLVIAVIYAWAQIFRKFLE